MRREVTRTGCSASTWAAPTSSGPSSRSGLATRSSQIASGWEPTHADGGPEVVTERLLVAGRAAITAHGPIAAAGVGVPGLFDAETGVIACSRTCLARGPASRLRERLGRGLGRPSRSSMTHARTPSPKAGWGPARAPDDGVCHARDRHRAAALMIDGKLHLGRNGRPARSATRPSRRTDRRAAAATAAAPRPLAQAKALPGSRAAPPSRRSTGRPRRATSVRRRHPSRPRATSASRSRTSSNVLGPDRVVVGGGIAAAGEMMLDPIRAAIREQSTDRRRERTSRSSLARARPRGRRDRGRPRRVRRAHGWHHRVMRAGGQYALGPRRPRPRRRRPLAPELVEHLGRARRAAAVGADVHHLDQRVERPHATRRLDPDPRARRSRA